MNLYSKKALFDAVIESEDAFEFHRDRYEAGHRDRIAVQCYQHWMLRKQSEKNTKS